MSVCWKDAQKHPDNIFHGRLSHPRELKIPHELEEDLVVQRRHSVYILHERVSEWTGVQHNAYWAVWSVDVRLPYILSQGFLCEDRS